jgi:hypothetical protein
MLADLMEDGLDDFRPLALALIEKDPTCAVDVFSTLPSELVTRLHPQDLLPLLQAPNATNRLLAIGVQGRLGAAGAESDVPMVPLEVMAPRHSHTAVEPGAEYRTEPGPTAGSARKR